MQIFDELFAYEERTGMNPELRANRFVRNKTWYVNENYMKKISVYPLLAPNSRKYKIPGLSRIKALKLLKNYAMSRKERELLPSTADVILNKRSDRKKRCGLNKRRGARLRAFYTTNHEHRYTLSIVLDSDRQLVERVKHEVAVREQLGSLKTINIPKVLGVEQREHAFILSEEMVLGRSFNARVDSTLYRKKLLPQLRDTYLAYGVRYAPIQPFLPPDLGANVTRLLGERADAKSFVETLKNVIEKNGLAAVSMCHGGLHPSHVVVTNGEVFFLDWKRANEGLIIFDLVRTPLIYPRLTSMIEDVREFMTSDFLGNSYMFEDMLAVGFAREILRNLHPRRISKLLRVWRRYALTPRG